MIKINNFKFHNLNFISGKTNYWKYSNKASGNE